MMMKNLKYSRKIKNKSTSTIKILNPLIQSFNINQNNSLKRTMIKIEEEQMLNSTNSDAIRFLHFHDEDSFLQLFPSNQRQGTQILNQNYDLVQILDEAIDLRTTPWKQIKAYLHINYNLNEKDVEKISYGILKKKMILKRMKAKNRNNFHNFLKIESKQTQSLVDLAIDDQMEVKKKRNRVSAQISRDRKKKQLQTLQQANRQLMKEAQKERKMNEQLKKQLQHAKKINTTESKSIRHQKNLFLQLLLFLGIIFLFTTFKQVLSSKNTKNMQQKLVCVSSSTKKNILQRVGGSIEYLDTFKLHPCFKSHVMKSIQTLQQDNTSVMMSNQIYQNLIKTTDLYFE